MPTQEPHSRLVVNEESSSSTTLWGFVLALLTFLLVVICVTSIRLISREAENTELPDMPPKQDAEDPSHEGKTPSTPSTDTPAQPDAPTEPTTPSTPNVPDGGDEQAPTTPSTPDPVAPSKSYLMSQTAQTVEMPAREGDAREGVFSTNAVIVDVSSGTILAGRATDAQMYPASMTKVMTLLVACEALKPSDYNASVTMSAEVIAHMQAEQASGFGFSAGDVVTVRDLLYAIALESDGAASIELATFVAGSPESFVQMMNAKAAALGLMNTHFTNVTGLHDPNHYTTCREMASMMVAAMDNAQVSVLLGEDTYVTSRLKNGAPQRITFFNTYYVDVMENGGGDYYNLQQIDAGARVIGAKTGSTPEAGKCLVTCVRSSSGNVYVTVTAGATNSAGYCADLLYMYQTYAR
jgi:D-alanyl-D-alanine carboxypeptidase (penicillin-binding protein 5/6)